MTKSERLQQIQDDLRKFHADADLGTEWRESGGRDVGVILTGCHLDNTFGSRQKDGIPSYYQEFVVHLTHKGPVVLSINLADLLALATDLRTGDKVEDLNAKRFYIQRLRPYSDELWNVYDRKMPDGCNSTGHVIIEKGLEIGYARMLAHVLNQGDGL